MSYKHTGSAEYFTNLKDNQFKGDPHLQDFHYHFSNLRNLSLFYVVEFTLVD